MSIASTTRTFHFRAGAPDGGVFAGQMQAASADEALAQLRRHGYQPLRLEASPLRQSILDRDVSFGGSKRLGPAECEAFSRELALLLSSGLVVTDAVSIMTPSLQRGSRLQKFCVGLRHGLRLGRSLSQAAEATGYIFPADFLPVVRAGEESGSLVTALGILAETYAESTRFTRTYIGALIYPALLLVVAILVLGLIAFFVAPNLAGLFTSMDRPIPFAIGALAGLSAFVATNLLLVGLFTVATFALLGFLLANPAFRGLLRSAAFRLPVIGNALTWSASRRFAATLQLYLASNVPIGSALPNALVAADFPDAERRAVMLGQDVRGGARLAASLEKARILPEKLLHMVRIGENSGRLVEVLGAVVGEAKAKFEQRMTLVSALLAPVLILLIGSLIGAIIFSVFTALLDINNMAL